MNLQSKRGEQSRWKNKSILRKILPYNYRCGALDYITHSEIQSGVNIEITYRTVLCYYILDQTAHDDLLYKRFSFGRKPLSGFNSGS